jgi:hypothetical protein
MNKFTKVVLLTALSVFLALPIFAANTGAYVSFAIPGSQVNGFAATFNVCNLSDSYSTCYNSGGAGDVTIYSDSAASASITQPATPGAVCSNGVYCANFYVATPGIYQILVEYTAPFPARNILYVVQAVGNNAGNIAANDGYVVLPASACASSVTSGTGGTGNNTYIIDGSVTALKANSTASTATLAITCDLSLPTRLTSGAGIVIQDVTFLYSQQGTNTTLSMVASPTLGTFTAPVASTSETASSATLVSAGGTLTYTPAVASANLTAVSAGQYYSEKVGLGTPFAVNTNLQDLILQFSFANSGSVAMLITVPGVIVHYSIAGA